MSDKQQQHSTDQEKISQEKIDREKSQVQTKPTAQYKKTHGAVTQKGSALKKYQQVIVGSESILSTVYFEFCSWVGVLPGAVGLLMRKIFWPRLFKHCGSGVQFAAGIVLRHPNRISIGNNVVISEGTVLDARNENVDVALYIGEGSMLSNNVVINCKGGTVHMGDNVGVGTQTVIQSTHNCPVQIGGDVIMGPRCFIVGGGSYNMDDLETPIRLQGIKPDKGCKIANNVWLGANVTVLGDADIQTGAVVAANGLVNSKVTENTIVGGIPAKKLKQR